MPKQASRPMRWAAEGGLLVAGALLGVIAYAYLGPLPAERSSAPATGTVVLSADGTILWRETSEGVRIPVAIDRVSQSAIDAMVAAEDQRFWRHPGIDPIAGLRAAAKLPWERSGGSTITQQLARRLYLEDSGLPLPLRKAREAVYALQLDARLGKQEILERYLNEAYYGRGAYGIEAAARVYFGVGAANLDVAQAAFLAGLPQQPWLGEGPSPGAWERQRYVLDRMLATGRLSRVAHAAAVAQPLAILDAPAGPIAEHFVRFALDEIERVAPEIAGRSGLVVETTLDFTLQAGSERQALLQLERLDDNDAGNAAVVVLDPRDGRILAMAGNVAPAGAGAAYNLATTPRQPGSALKPFLYGLALQRGYTAASPLLDVPTTLPARHGVYTPINYDESYRGVVTLRTALASSLNVPAVRMVDELGVDAFLRELHRYGLSTLTAAEQYDLALALGAGEVRPLDLAAAYAVLASEGVYREPFAVVRVLGAGGEVLYERPEGPPRPVIPAEVAFLVTDILADPDARVAGFGTGSILQLPFRAAVKTGTTTEFRDNWTVGFTPRQVVAVWVGNADSRPMGGVSGVSGAAPIWAEVMKLARERQGDAWFMPPEGIERAAVCHPTGLRPGSACPSPAEEWFVAGTAPDAVEQYYVRDAGGRVAIAPPPIARPWLGDAGYPLAGAEASAGGLAIVQPADGTVVFLAPELPRQEMVVRVACPPAIARVTVMRGGEVVTVADECPDRVITELSAGVHTLQVEAELVDGRVVRAGSTYEVRVR